MNQAFDAALQAFVEESNRIEGILALRPVEVKAHEVLLARDEIVLDDVVAFVSVVAGARLRERAGMNVRVGNHVPPPGGPEIGRSLTSLLRRLFRLELTPYEGHVAYEQLHPFMDGNGRSGRAIWAWHMMTSGQDPFALPFLHRWYYQALDASRKEDT